MIICRSCISVLSRVDSVEVGVIRSSREWKSDQLRNLLAGDSFWCHTEWCVLMDIPIQSPNCKFVHFHHGGPSGTQAPNPRKYTAMLYDCTEALSLGCNSSETKKSDIFPKREYLSHFYWKCLLSYLQVRYAFSSLLGLAIFCLIFPINMSEYKSMLKYCSVLVICSSNGGSLHDVENAWS